MSEHDVRLSGLLSHPNTAPFQCIPLHPFFIPSSSGAMQNNAVQQWTDDDLTFAEKYPDGVPLVKMIPFYEMVAHDEPLKLEWVFLGKRDPKSEQKSAPTPHSLPSVTPKVSESRPDASKLAEFDFDEGTNPSPFQTGIVDANQPLRRAVAPGRHPVRQPRVANMDKILNDLFRTRKEASQQPNPAVEPPQNVIIDNASETDRGDQVQPNASACNDTHCDPEIILDSSVSNIVVNATTAPLVVNMNAIDLDDNVVKPTFKTVSNCDDVNSISNQALVRNIDFTVRSTMFQGDAACNGTATDVVQSTSTVLDKTVPSEPVDSG